MGNERVVELDQYEFNTVITLINEKRNNMIKEKQNPEKLTQEEQNQFYNLLEMYARNCYRNDKF